MNYEFMITEKSSILYNIMQFLIYDTVDRIVLSINQKFYVTDNRYLLHI